MIKKLDFSISREVFLPQTVKDGYDKYINGTLNESIAKRCCNFKLLEEKCIEYNKIN